MASCPTSPSPFTQAGTSLLLRFASHTTIQLGLSLCHAALLSALCLLLLALPSHHHASSSSSPTVTPAGGADGGGGGGGGGLGALARLLRGSWAFPLQPAALLLVGGFAFSAEGLLQTAVGAMLSPASSASSASASAHASSLAAGMASDAAAGAAKAAVEAAAATG